MIPRLTPRAFTSVSKNGLLDILYTPIIILNKAKGEYVGKKTTTTTIRGLWDTGASRTAISQNLAEKLELVPITQVPVNTAGGQKLQNVYIVDVGLPNNIIIPDLQVTGAELIDIDILIGMDIITLGDFVITNHEGKTAFSFVCPSQQRIDFCEGLGIKAVDHTQGLNREQKRAFNKKKKKR